MIRIKLVSPLPNMLGLSRKIETIEEEVEYREGITLYEALRALGANHSIYRKKLENEEMDEIFKGKGITVDGVIFDEAGRGGTVLQDGCSVTVTMLYAGG